MKEYNLKSGGLIEMNEVEFRKTLNHLLEILREAPQRRMLFDSTCKLLKDWIKLHIIEGDSNLSEKVIDYALDNWLIDKVIDYPSFDGDVPLGRLSWFLKFLDENESEYLRTLSPEEQELLKILRECTTPDELGIIHEDIALKMLRERGFDVNEVPFIKDKVSEFFTTDDDGKLVGWHRLIPEYELTEEYKAEMERRDREDAKREMFMMELDE